MNPSSLKHWLTPRRLMMASIGVALITITLKTLAWWLTGSVGLLSDAMESFVNLAAATFGLSMVTLAARPADDDHPYGHDKAEYFSSSFEGILIIGAAGAIIWAAALRLWHPQPLEQISWGAGLAVASSALNGLLAWIMLRAARTHRSFALEADARHLITDIWTSAGVIVGIVLTDLTGLLWLDPLVAMGVALHILHEGARLLWRSAQDLMDPAAEPEVLQKIDAVLQTFTRHHGSQPVVHFDHIMTRKSGPRRFVNLHMHLPPGWTLDRAAQLRAQVEHGLVTAVPHLFVNIEMLPDGVEPLHTDLMEAAEASRVPEHSWQGKE
ncbi:MAG: cation diffusion facilitator family transporter [Ottowia sp.]|nr:cation diffusion facilitator family transporter [Ottowia sp.]